MLYIYSVMAFAIFPSSFSAENSTGVLYCSSLAECFVTMFYNGYSGTITVSV